MKLACPHCGDVFDLEAAIEDADGRRWVALLAEMPPVTIRPLIHYLRLFKPDRQSLRWSRLLRLTQDIEPMIKAARVSRHGTALAAPPEQWAAAMLGLVDTPPKSLRLPLKSHGYLLEVLAGQADRVAARAERAVETQRQQRALRDSGQASDAPRSRERYSGPAPVATMLATTANKPRSQPPAGWAHPVKSETRDE